MAKILVVEDSPTEMKLMLDALRPTPHEIATAVDGEEAMKKAEKLMPDLILLDVVLPKKNGFQVCRGLKTALSTESIKIVLVTSKTQDSDRFWGLKQGADDYLGKPFDDAELLDLVERYT